MRTRPSAPSSPGTLRILSADAAIELLVVGREHHAHPALAEDPDQQVSTDPRAVPREQAELEALARPELVGGRRGQLTRPTADGDSGRELIPVDIRHRAELSGVVTRGRVGRAHTDDRYNHSRPERAIERTGRAFARDDGALQEDDYKDMLFRTSTRPEARPGRTRAPPRARRRAPAPRRALAEPAEPSERGARHVRSRGRSRLSSDGAPRRATRSTTPMIASAPGSPSPSGAPTRPFNVSTARARATTPARPPPRDHPRARTDRGGPPAVSMLAPRFRAAATGTPSARDDIVR